MDNRNFQRLGEYTTHPSRKSIPKMLLVCLSATVLLVSLGETTAKNVPAVLFSRNLKSEHTRLRRADADDDVISYFEDLLSGIEKEPKEKEPVYHSECGRVDVQPTPLITHGVRAERGKWPWHAALYHFVDGAHSYKCGGSLVGRRTVVTAAHCVKDKFGLTLDPETLIVYLGKHHLKFWNGIQEKQVLDIIVHPDYSGETVAADISILILSSPADYSSFVRPVCLWDKNQVVEKGTPGTVIGWGRDENGKITGELMTANMPIISDLICIKSYPELFAKFVNERNFCAGYRNGTSACNGDSGGGMVFPILTTSNRMQQWYLRGIVSLSATKPNSLHCDPMHYIIFTDVGEFYDWIKGYLR